MSRRGGALRFVRREATLLSLLAAVALAGLAWALVVPPFQVPDEQAHVAYAQFLAERGERPPGQGPPGVAPYSSEIRLADYHARGTGVNLDRDMRPPWTEGAESRWEAAQTALPDEAREDSVAIPLQGDNPPVYYAWEAVPYLAAAGGDLFDRLFLMRLWSAALLLVTATAAWLLAGELFGGDRLLRLVAATCVGLQPMTTFISAGVNPDAAFLPLAGLVLWLCVRILRRGPTRATVAGLAVCLLLAALVKVTALALVPPAGFAVAVALVRARRSTDRGWSRRGTLIAAASVAAAIVAAFGLAGLLGFADRIPSPLSPERGFRGFASYLWQFYLPRLEFQAVFPEYAGVSLWETWVKGSWANFGALQVRFPEPVYWGFATISVGAFAAAAVAVARRAWRPRASVVAFLVLAALSLVLGLHWVEYEAGGPRNQGRYLLPLMPIAGVAVAAGLANLRGRVRALGAGAVLGGMVALQLISLATVAGYFYA